MKQILSKREINFLNRVQKEQIQIHPPLKKKLTHMGINPDNSIGEILIAISKLDK